MAASALDRSRIGFSLLLASSLLLSQSTGVSMHGEGAINEFGMCKINPSDDSLIDSNRPSSSCPPPPTPPVLRGPSMHEGA